MATHQRLGPVLALILLAVSLGGCGQFNQFGSTAMLSDRECLARVMYFESNRSSDEGMLAVGTVVMNRLQSPKYPKTVCGVIGQTNQFAEGALTKPVLRRSTSWTRAERVADAVLGGERHEAVRDGKFFHTAGYTFPYRNMHYLTLAGGNRVLREEDPGHLHPRAAVGEPHDGGGCPAGPGRRADASGDPRGARAAGAARERGWG